MPHTNLPAPGPKRDQPAAAPTAPFYLNREQIARAIPVSPRTVDDWRERGIIPFLKIRGIVRFDLAKVRAALEKRFEIKANAVQNQGRVVSLSGKTAGR